MITPSASAFTPMARRRALRRSTHDRSKKIQPARLSAAPFRFCRTRRAVNSFRRSQMSNTARNSFRLNCRRRLERKMRPGPIGSLPLNTPMIRRRLDRIECRRVIVSNRSIDFRSGGVRPPKCRMKPFLTANWRYLSMLNYVVDPRILAPLVPPGTEIDFENGETFVSIVGFLFLDTRLLGLPIPLHRDFEEVNLRFYVRRKWESLKMRAAGEPQAIPARTHAEFITEHYWGYTSLGNGCGEYRVEHPRWRFWTASDFELNAEIATLYGQQFAETLRQRPRSAFIADGSPITVHTRQIL